MRRMGRLVGGTAMIVAAGWLASAPAAPEPIAFEDVAPRSGIDFVLRNAATGDRRQIETMVGGVAVFDYNNDGWPDLYFVNGATQPSLEKTDPTYYNRLYRNKGDGTFA